MISRSITKNDYRPILRWSVWLTPVIVLLSMTLPGITQGDWQRGDSGWYAAIAVQAWRNGELWTLWGEPGQPYFNKPPMVFWIVGLVMHVFEPGALTARLPTVFAAAWAVVATVGMSRLFTGRATAGVIGCVLALTIEFTRRTHEVSLDVWQLAMLMTAVWLAAGGVVRGRGGLVVLSGIGIGLALMCKPLVGLVALVAIGVWAGMVSRRYLVHVALAAVVAAGLAGIWHGSMWVIHGREFVAQYVGAEVVDRAGGAVDRTKPWFFYGAQLGKNYWPWLPALVFACVAAARGRLFERDHRIVSLAVVWCALWLLVLTVFPDRRDRYAIVLYPFFSVMVGGWLVGVGPQRLRLAARWVWLYGARVIAVVALMLAVAAPIRFHQPPGKEWGELHSWMDSEDVGEIWQGGLAGYRGSRLYLENGKWPRTTRDRWGHVVEEPPVGAFLLYHRRDGLAPGDNEEVIETFGKNVFVTRLEEGSWSPVEVPDPGDERYSGRTRVAHPWAFSP